MSSTPPTPPKKKNRVVPEQQQDEVVLSEGENDGDSMDRGRTSSLLQNATTTTTNASSSSFLWKKQQDYDTKTLASESTSSIVNEKILIARRRELARIRSTSARAAAAASSSSEESSSTASSVAAVRQQERQTTSDEVIRRAKWRIANRKDEVPSSSAANTTTNEPERQQDEPSGDGQVAAGSGRRQSLPGAWAIRRSCPQETLNDEMGRRRRNRPSSPAAAAHPGQGRFSVGSSHIATRNAAAAAAAASSASHTSGLMTVTTAAAAADGSSTLVQATLVTEPPVVQAVPVLQLDEQQPRTTNDNSAASVPNEEEVNKIVRTALQEEREQSRRTYRKFCIVLVVIVVLIGVVALGLIFGLLDVNETSVDSSSSSSSGPSAIEPAMDSDAAAGSSPPPPPPPPAPPTAETAAVTARCFQAPIEIFMESNCEPVPVSVTLVDRGSSSSSGRPLASLSLVPPGPYGAGTHNVSLVAKDQRGNTDSCPATIVVSDALTGWKLFQNHAYRVRGCKISWADAQAAAAATTTGGLCGGSSRPAHLATISSVRERNFVVDLTKSLDFGNAVFWLGGYQPPELPDELEPRGNWTWVNGEGLIYNGYTDWDHREPNGVLEDCLVLLGDKRGYHWDDRPCGVKNRFIEEVDLLPVEATVVVNGCDSGVPDVITDASTCSHAITPGIIASCTSPQTSNKDDFGACVDRFLTPLVDKGDLSLLDKERILNCGSDNRSPQAVCQNVQITIGATDPSAEVASVEVSRFDGGSTDPDGDSPLRLELQPLSGPYGVGNHTLTLTVADGQGGADSCQATLTISDENQPPVARCRDVLELMGGSRCSQVERVDGSQLDNGSSDPEGASLNFKVTPPGPYGVGRHTLTLTASDNRGYSDTCETTLVVVESLDTSLKTTPWMIFDNHAYRVHLCEFLDWETAKESSAAVSLCGGGGSSSSTRRRAAHLATITSAPERNAVRSMVSGLGLGNDEFWLGGFQAERAQEPAGAWRWVNNEGQIFNGGFTDWDRNEPNNQGTEDCLIMHGSGKGYRWDDKDCSNQYRYIEEVDMVTTVVIDGCDSRVPDVLIDAESCSYEIAEGISSCVNNGGEDRDAENVFVSCVDQYLAALVANGNITTKQKDAIAQCAGLPLPATNNSNTTRRHLRGYSMLSGMDILTD